jgi:hypothetical protein
MINIFMLYVGIIVAIQEHTSDYYHGGVHTFLDISDPIESFKGLASIEYVMKIRDMGFESVLDVFGMVPIALRVCSG